MRKFYVSISQKKKSQHWIYESSHEMNNYGCNGLNRIWFPKLMEMSNSWNLMLVINGLRAENWCNCNLWAVGLVGSVLFLGTCPKTVIMKRLSVWDKSASPVSLCLLAHHVIISMHMPLLHHPQERGRKHEKPRDNYL